MKKNIVVLLTCVGGRLIYDIINSIRSSNDYKITLIGIDTNKESPGRLLCDHFEVVKSVEKNEKSWLSDIFRLHKKYKFDLLMSLSEGECLCVSKNIALFKKKKIKVTVADIKFVQLTTDKHKLMNVLKKNGLNTGQFLKIDSFDDAKKALKKLGYPEKKVIFKPRNSRGSRGVLVVDALKKKFASLLKDRFCATGSFQILKYELKKRDINLKDYIAMPYYSNDISDVDCISKNGKLVDIVVRLRQLKNPLMPTSTGHIIKMDDRIIDYAKNICRVLKINGPCDFDIVIDYTGKPILLDAGSRFSGSVGCSFNAGYNIVSQLVRFYFDIPLKKFRLKNYALRPFITMIPIPKSNSDELL